MKNDIKFYLAYLNDQKNYSKLTIQNYEEDLLFLYDYYEIEHLNYLKIEYSDIRLFYNYLDEHNYSKSTISRKISSIRSFYKYLARKGKIKNNPFSLAILPKKDKLLPKFLYYNELEEMLNVPNLSTPLGQRNRTILEVLYATGVRVGELVEIKLNDISLNEMTIKVLGKGNKERIVFFGEYALDYLERYLNNGRIKLLKKPNNYLFLNARGDKISTRGVELIIKNIIEETSIKTNITPHTLRHTFATHLLNEGCDIISVQELLGHSSLRATQVYTHITTEGLRNIYLKSHPRNQKKIK